MPVDPDDLDAGIAHLRGASPVAHSASGTDGLLRFRTQIDLSTRLVLLNRPVDDPIRWRLTDPRQLRPRDVRDFLWVRMLDTERALASRCYPIAGTLVVEIADRPALPLDDSGWTRAPMGRAATARPHPRT